MALGYRGSGGLMRPFYWFTQCVREVAPASSSPPDILRFIPHPQRRPLRRYHVALLTLQQEERPRPMFLRLCQRRLTRRR